MKEDFKEPIEYCRAKKRGYYISEAQFTRTELAVLIDCVCNASFVTKADVLRLTNKLKDLSNIHDLPMLNPLSDDNNQQEGNSIIQNTQVASDLRVDAFLIPVDKYHFKVTITARIDTDFCEWIEGYGCCAKILSPQDAVDFFRAQHKDKTYNLKMLYEHNLEPTYLLTGEEIENLTSEELDLIRPDLHANIQTVIDDNMKLSYVVRKND